MSALPSPGSDRRTAHSSSRLPRFPLWVICTALHTFDGGLDKTLLELGEDVVDGAFGGLGQPVGERGPGHSEGADHLLAVVVGDELGHEVVDGELVVGVHGLDQVDDAAPPFDATGAFVLVRSSRPSWSS